MSFFKNAYGVYEADIRDRVVGRVRVSLKTKKAPEATRRHSALEALVRSGDVVLVDELRARRLNIEAVERCARDQQPFATLHRGYEWPTLGEAIDEYLAWMEAHPNRAKNTYTQAKHYLTRVRELLGEDRRVDRITHEMVDEMVASLRGIVSDLTKKPLSAWSVSLHLQKLGALYTWLTKREARRAAEAKRPPHPLHSPLDRELITTHGGGRVRFLSEEEAARVIAATPDSMRFPVLLGLLCGLRLGEVVHLRPPPHDIDLENGLIIVQPKDGWRVKTGTRREVPIPAELRPVAERHLREFASAEWVVPSPVLEGTPLTEHRMGQVFKRIAADAGLSTSRGDPLKVTFHTLRHTFASWLIMAGRDLFTVAKLMGHSSIDRLVDTYGHLSPDHKQRAMAQLGAWLGSLHLMEDAV